MSSPPDHRRVPAWLRFVPYVVVAGVLVAIVARSAGNGSSDPPAADDGPAEVLSPVVTFDEADQTGLQVDFGPTCDPATGRVVLPLAAAPPCVAPRSDGATSAVHRRHRAHRRLPDPGTSGDPGGDRSVGRRARRT